MCFSLHFLAVFAKKTKAILFLEIVADFGAIIREFSQQQIDFAGNFCEILVREKESFCVNFLEKNISGWDEKKLAEGDYQQLFSDQNKRTLQKWPRQQLSLALLPLPFLAIFQFG